VADSSYDHPRLYRLAPLGRCTGQVESLTGFVARLARRHSLATGRLILDEIAPHVWPHDLGGVRLLARVLGDARTGPLDGSGPRSAQWTRVLEMLTWVEGLRELTTASWRPAIGNRGLLKPVAAYCPSCFALDLEVAGDRDVSEPYERLAWRLAGVEICLIHGVPLLTRCLWCDRPRPPLAYWSLPGYCPYCHRWLGMVEPNVRTQLVSQWATKSAWLIEDALLKRSSDPETVQVVSGVAAVIDATTGGNRAAFARLIGLRSSSVIAAWFGGVKPSLGSLVRIAAAVGSDLTSILAGAPAAGRFETMNPPRSRPHRRRGAIDWSALEAQLKSEAAQPDPTSLSAIAREHDVPVQEVRNRLHDAARHLVDQAASARSRRSEERRAHLEGVLEAVMADLRHEGLDRSRRNIEPRLPAGVTLEERPLQDAWRRGR